MGPGALISLLALLAGVSHALRVRPAGDGLPWNASVSVDLSQPLPMSPILHGIFFEEVGRRCSRGWRPLMSRPAHRLPPPA